MILSNGTRNIERVEVDMLTADQEFGPKYLFLLNPEQEMSIIEIRRSKLQSCMYTIHVYLYV